MPERRHSPRDKVIYGGTAEIAEGGASRDCVVRNISESGAHLEFKSPVGLSKDSLRLTIARKGRSFLARIIWRQANRLGLAFRTMITDRHESDLDARLRKSEKKKRQLQRRIDELLGQD